MAKQVINTGTAANSKNGDPLRTAFTKVNANFDELYSGGLIPTQTGNSGKFLTTSGTVLSWASGAGGTTDYNNLTNKPTIPAAQVQTDWNAVSGLGVVLNKPALFSGSYTDLTNKPTIPAAQVSADWNSSTGVTQILNKPALFSGSYTDLTNKPTIPGGVGDFVFTNGSASLPLGDTMTLNTYQNGGNKESKLTLAPTGDSALDVGGGLRVRTFYGTGFEKSWTFNTDGSVTFPNATTQTTAWTGSVSSLVNGANTVSLDNGGLDLTFTSGEKIKTTFGGGIELYRSGDNTIGIYASGAEIKTFATGGAKHTWTFGTNGKLSLPNNGKITSGVDVAQVGSTTTIALNNLGTDQANNNITVGIDWTGNEAVFTTYAAGSTITFANGDVRTITEIQKNEVYGEPGLFAIDIYWSTGTPRENLTAFPITLKTSNYVAAYTAPQWTFGTNGKLTAPGNLQVDGGKIILNTGGNAYIESVDYGVNSANSAVNIFGGPYQKIKLRAGFGTEAAWTFGIDGTLTVPGSIIGTVTQNVFNTTSTTVNAFGAATTLNIGAAGGTTTIAGDLTVSGTTTTINSTTLTVDDKNIELGSVATPTNTTADGGGISLKGATDKTFNWVNATGAWTSSEDLNLLTGKVYKIDGTTVLSSTTLGSGVTLSSLTTVGTIGTGVWNGTVVAGQYGGTGVANTGKTITLGGNLTTSGAFATTLTATATTSVTLPTTGTLATLDGTETLSNKTAGVATTTSTAASVGYIGMPQNSKSANYGLVIGDMGKHVYVTATSTVTVPAYTSVDFPIGTTIAVVAGTGATVSIAITTDTMNLAGPGTTGTRTLAPFGMATLVKVAQSTWFISGVGLT